MSSYSFSIKALTRQLSCMCLYAFVGFQTVSVWLAAWQAVHTLHHACTRLVPHTWKSHSTLSEHRPSIELRKHIARNYTLVAESSNQIQFNHRFFCQIQIHLGR